jgi:rare lipoprotein A (peptidoglycan hydrolase)
MHSNGLRVRRASSIFLSVVLLAAALGTARMASAQSVDRRLSKARSQELAARDAVRRAERRLRTVLREFQTVQKRVSRAAVGVVASYQSQEVLTDELEAAQETLNRRAAEAYEAGGPAITLELFLGSSSPADFASAQEFAARALVVGSETVRDVTRLRTALASLTAQREAQRRELAVAAERLEELATQAAGELQAARQKARKAGLAVRKLEREHRALRQAQAAANSSLDSLVNPSRGKDQKRLLAFLGPTGGRTCQIPPGLRDTGRQLSGYSSWYGWEFAGQATASGAIFDPRLFTLANKELPLGVFLRIHFKGKCAIALVNDRGPFGVPGRIFDVAEAVAAYLGYKGAGVAHISTDILVPA